MKKTWLLTFVLTLAAVSHVRTSPVPYPQYDMEEPDMWSNNIRGPAWDDDVMGPYPYPQWPPDMSDGMGGPAWDDDVMGGPGWDGRGGWDEVEGGRGIYRWWQG